MCRSPCRKPKDAKAGLSSGLKSAAKGIVGGAVSLFAAPVVMAREEGVKGFAKGIGAGGLLTLSMLAVQLQGWLHTQAQWEPVTKLSIPDIQKLYAVLQNVTAQISKTLGQAP